MGATIRRREDPRLISGSARYVDDIQIPGTAFMGVLRCPHAHARIRGIDLSRVRRDPRVLAAVTARDLSDLAAVAEVEEAQDREPGGEEGGGARPPLAVDVARFAGEGVAAVVATDRYAAEDVLELIDVDYEPLRPFLDIESMAPEWEDFPEAKPSDDGLPVGTERQFSFGDVDSAFQQADVIISQRIVNQRVAPIPMETRGVLAQYNAASGDLLVYNSTQCAHFVRDALCEALNLPYSKVRVVAPEVGGGFGCKIGKYPEDVLAAFFSIRLNCPIKWVESRSECFLGTVHGRSQIGDIQLAASSDGRILGLRLDLLADTGAYDAGWLGQTTAGMITGCYDIRNVRTKARTIYTNKTPLGAYRGAGRPEAAFFIERAIDILASELRIAPPDVRRKNFVKPADFPYKTPDWPVFDSGNYAAALDAAIDRVDYAHLLALRDAARAEGRISGVGLASYVEVTGFGWETATLTVEADGAATVYTGISPHGQGQETTFSQIVADVCGIDPEQIRVTYGDTALGYGQGTMGSRGTSVGGTALYRAACEIRDKMREIAANRLEAAPVDLELNGGAWKVKGAPNRFETVKAIAKAATSGQDLTEGMEPGLRATGTFDPEDVTAPFGTHVAAVEIDRDTGQVTVRRFLTVDDCGTIVSPQLVEGQIHGGVLQGVAQALLEEVVYDDEGQLITGSLAHYAMPTIGEAVIPEVTHTHTPSTRNELGVKGIGEAGSIGSTPALANAVMDALSPLGIRHLDMPFTPERVWRAMQGVAETGAAEAAS